MRRGIPDFLSVAIGCGLLLALACQQKPVEKATKPAPPEVRKAVAVIHPTEGNNVHGVVSFVILEGGVMVTADVTGLPPGPHGFHIHQYGDCTSPDGKSAGGHFNPMGEKHGAPDSLHRHVGDLGNLIADENGEAHYKRLDTVLKLAGPASIIGRAVIIHEKADDFTSQPTGNAGARLACGVIGISKP